MHNQISRSVYSNFKYKQIVFGFFFVATLFSFIKSFTIFEESIAKAAFTEIGILRWEKNHIHNTHHITIKITETMF